MSVISRVIVSPQMKRIPPLLGSVLLVLIFACTASLAAKLLHHYVFFGQDREKIRETKSFLETKAFEGAQVAYSWRQLEPGKDEYDFTLIRDPAKGCFVLQKLTIC